MSQSHHSRMLHMLACLPLLPVLLWALTLKQCLPSAVTTFAGGDPVLCPIQEPKGPGSFGCSVNLPLGSRSVDPHSTAVGVETCSTPVLNRILWGYPLFTRWSTRYYNQDLHQKTLQPGLALTSSAISHALSTQRCSALASTAMVDCEGASLTWAPSIFGAESFGR